MIENYIKEADRVTYLMPKEVDHHCAGQIIAELDALIEGCGVRKIVFDMKQTEFMDSSGIGVIIGRTKKLKYFNDSSVSVCNMSDRVDKHFENVPAFTLLYISFKTELN